MNNTCAHCKEPGNYRNGRQLFCAIHYRMKDMRTKAKVYGKTVPSREQIKILFDILVKNGMRCPGCQCLMHWTVRLGPLRSVVSLQHDRSGQIKLICQSCNTRHHHVKGDLFYEIPKGSKYCCGCNQILTLESFSSSSTSLLAVRSRCRKCSYELKKKWVNANRKRASDYEHARRIRKKEASCDRG